MPTQHNQFIYIVEVVLQYNFTLLRNFWIGRGEKRLRSYFEEEAVHDGWLQQVEEYRSKGQERW